MEKVIKVKNCVECPYLLCDDCRKEQQIRESERKQVIAEIQLRFDEKIDDLLRQGNSAWKILSDAKEYLIGGD